MALSAWDLQIIAELEQEIQVIEKAISGKTNQEFVRLPYGDARPMLVGAHRTNVQIKYREIESIRQGE